MAESQAQSTFSYKRPRAHCGPHPAPAAPAGWEEPEDGADDDPSSGVAMAVSCLGSRVGVAWFEEGEVSLKLCIGTKPTAGDAEAERQGAVPGPWVPSPPPLPPLPEPIWHLVAAAPSPTCSCGAWRHQTTHLAPSATSSCS